MADPAPKKKPFPVLLVGAGLLVLIAVIAVLVSSGGDDDDGDGDGAALQETAPVEVSGTPLPTLEDPANDPAVGRPSPSVSGVSFDGTPVTLGGEGPQLIMFVAHWCPHCQAEVPVITDWLDDDGEPEGVALRAMSTGVQASAPNYPPSAWLDEEGWPVPTLADDPESTGASAFGLSAFPFFVAVDGDGSVAARVSGELTVDQLEALVDAARG